MKKVQDSYVGVKSVLCLIHSRFLVQPEMNGPVFAFLGSLCQALRSYSKDVLKRAKRK